MSVKQIVIKGRASQRIYFQGELLPEEKKLTILEFIKLKEIPIASSCGGEGVCKKCVINGNIVSCMHLMTQVNQLLPQGEIIIFYL